MFPKTGPYWSATPDGAGGIWGISHGFYVHHARNNTMTRWRPPVLDGYEVHGGGLDVSQVENVPGTTRMVGVAMLAKVAEPHQHREVHAIYSYDEKGRSLPVTGSRVGALGGCGCCDGAVRRHLAVDGAPGSQAQVGVIVAAQPSR